MQKLIVVRGLPGSGKTTLAKEMCANSGRKLHRVNRDDLRALHPNWVRHKFNKKVEKDVAEQRDVLINNLLLCGFSVISDDTNLTDKHINHFKQLAQEYRVEFEIIDLRDVPVETCIERDRQRQWPVGKDVILKMYYENIVKPTGDFPRIARGNAIICDIDGTLAHMQNRGAFDEDKYSTDLVDFPMLHILDALQDEYFIYLVSGRQGTDVGRSNTEKWLRAYAVPYDALLMREAGDTRKDNIVKREIYERDIAPNHEVEFVFDDRPQVIRMYRELGLKVFDCGMGYEF